MAIQTGGAMERSREAMLRTGPLYTREVGSGPSVLMLHPFPLSGHVWQPQLEGLADRARLLAPDLPGFGLTPPVTGAPSLDDYARLVVELLDDLKISKVVVVGESMGGYVAFRLLAHWPERIQALLLASTRPTADDVATVERRRALAAQIVDGGPRVADEEMLSQLLGATTHRARSQLVEAIRRIIHENPAEGLAAALSAMARRPDSCELLPRIRVPTICLAGDEDAITPPGVVRAMAELIPGAEVRVFEAAGHLVNVEAPAAFNEALEDLLSA